jgi:hypothetical protein
MRNHCRLFRGYEVRTEGDAFMIAFQDPFDALAWCLAVQTTLLYADWPEKLYEFPASKIVRGKDEEIIFRGLRVRMGVHTGTPEIEADPHTGRAGYFGPMAHRAHNVGAAGHGGQILISGLTWEHVKDRLEELGNPSVRDMGLHRLPEMSTDEPIRSVVPIELRNRQFPIPRSARPPTSLILEYIEDIRQQTVSLEGKFQAISDRIYSMLDEGSTSIAAVEGLVANFSGWQKIALLDEEAKLTALIVKHGEAKAELEALWVLERNAKRGMDSMDGVLANVTKQLNIVPKLEARIASLRKELRNLKIDHQKERNEVQDLLCS